MFNQRTKIKQLLSSGVAGQQVTVMGWVRTFRNNQFIALNDGSTNHNVQVVATLGAFDEALLKRLTTNASIKVTGEVVSSLGKGQALEVKAATIEILGDSDAEKYPLQPKKHSLEFSREKAHLRFRTNTFGSVFRVRHSLAFAVHQFFHDKGFIYLHTPIITASDAEGAGETFRVTNLPIENPPLKNKKIDELADKYYLHLVNSFSKAEISINSVDDQIKKFDNKLTFEKIVKATEGEIRSIRKNNNLKELNGYFNELYKKTKKFIKKNPEISENSPKEVIFQIPLILNSLRKNSLKFPYKID